MEIHHSFLQKGGHSDQLLEERVRQKFLDELQDTLFKEVLERIEKNTAFDRIIRSLVEKTEDPYSQVEKVMKEVLKQGSG